MLALSNDKLSAALALANGGAHIVPVHPATELPINPDLRLEGLDAVRTHWEANPNHGIGILLGTASAYSAAIEIDDTPKAKAAWENLRSKYPSLPDLHYHPHTFESSHLIPNEKYPGVALTAENLGTGEIEKIMYTPFKREKIGATLLVANDAKDLNDQELGEGVRLRTSGVLVMPIGDDDSPIRREWRITADWTNDLAFPTTDSFEVLQDDFIAAFVSTTDITTSLENVTLEAIEFLWEPFVPRGKLTLLAGEPKDGKSVLAVNLCAALTAGRALPCEPDDVRRKPETVVFFTAEDGIGDTVLPRAMEAKANLSLFRTAGLMYSEWENKKRVDKVVTLANTVKLREILETHRPALVVIDPIQAFIGAAVDMNKANSVRPVLAGIALLAQEFDATIILIMHLTKSTEGRGANRVLGSVDFIAAARCVLMTARDPSSQKRYLCLERATYGGDDAALEYSIEDGTPIPIPNSNRKVKVAAVAFGDEIETLRRDDIMKREDDGGSIPGLARTKIMIREALANGARVSSDDLRQKCRVSVSTWKRAKSSLEKDDEFIIRNIPVKDSLGQVLRWEIQQEVFGTPPKPAEQKIEEQPEPETEPDDGRWF